MAGHDVRSCPCSTCRDARKHAESISRRVSGWIIDKYIKGASEHGGRLGEQKIPPLILEEALDLCCYIVTMMDQLRETRGKLVPECPGCEEVLRLFAGRDNETCA